MRLVEIIEEDEDYFNFSKFDDGPKPQYAILSHTWENIEEEEVTYQDLMKGNIDEYRQKKGFRKLEFCRQQTLDKGLKYFWMDTCCIDKSNPEELASTVKAMYRYYENSQICFVYLSDVAWYTKDGTVKHRDPALGNSRWFTRGWTLQELLAPKIVEFYDRDSCRLGDKKGLAKEICEVTKIKHDALSGDMPLSKFSVKERRKWMNNRYTRREEDIAYCQLGIMGVSMEIIYGEREDRAMDRLNQAIAAKHPWWKRWQFWAAAFLWLSTILFALINSPQPPYTVPDGGIDSNYPIFAILGRTGVGKSSFIKLLGGRNDTGFVPGVCHGLEPCTNEISFYSATVNGSSIYLMDTPGFDDVRMSDREVMELIYKTLLGLQKDDKLLKGLIYLHDINEVRVGGLAQKQFDAFDQLLGASRSQHLMFVTTKWPENPTEQEELELHRRHEALQKDYWYKMIKYGAQVKMFTRGLGEAQTIILDLLNAPKMRRLSSPTRMNFIYDMKDRDAERVETGDERSEETDRGSEPAPQMVQRSFISKIPSFIAWITFGHPWIALTMVIVTIIFINGPPQSPPDSLAKDALKHQVGQLIDPALYAPNYDGSLTTSANADLSPGAARRLRRLYAGREGDSSPGSGTGV